MVQGNVTIEIVSKAGFEKAVDIGMEPLATLSKDRSLSVCFQCHATKTRFERSPICRVNRSRLILTEAAGAIGLLHGRWARA